MPLWVLLFSALFCKVLRGTKYLRATPADENRAPQERRSIYFRRAYQFAAARLLAAGHAFLREPPPQSHYILNDE